MINLLFFGSLGDLAINVPSQLGFNESLNTPTAIRSMLTSGHPELANELQQNYILVAIDGELADWDSPVSKNSEVVFMPPVTGG